MSEDIFEYFPPISLYRSIAENDLNRLDDAIFFFGPQVHEFYVWSDLTAILYAARLGQLEQVEILLRDLEKYGDGYLNVVKKLIFEILPHRDDPLGKRLLCQLMDMYTNRSEDDYFLVEAFVDGNVVDLLLDIAKRTPHKIPRIVQLCFESGSAKAFRAIRFDLEDDPSFIDIVQKLFEKDGLIHAIMIGDVGEFSRLLKDFCVCNAEQSSAYYSGYRSSRILMGDSLSFKSVFHNKTRFYEVVPSLKFVRLVVQTDDVDILKVLYTPENVSDLMESIGRPEKVLLDAILSTALENQSMEILKLILDEDRFIHCDDSTDWNLMYFSLLLDGKIKSAAAVKHLCDSNDCENAASPRLHPAKLMDTILPKIVCKADAPRELLQQINVELQLYFQEYPESIELSERLQETMCGLPMRNFRPDLVETFRVSSIERLETEVALANAERSRHFWRETWDSLPMRAWWSDIEVPVSYDLLRDDYLAECECKNVKIESSCTLTSSGKALLKLCITQSNRMPSFSLTSIADTEYIEECENARKETLNLQKLCRKTIRGALCNARIRTVTHALLSLYVDGCLPRKLVNYLLYRDDCSEQPLYYALVRGNLSSNAALYTRASYNPSDYCEPWDRYNYRDNYYDPETYYEEDVVNYDSDGNPWTQRVTVYYDEMDHGYSS